MANHGKVVLFLVVTAVAGSLAHAKVAGIPQAWEDAVEHADALFAETNPAPGYFPYVGNGYVATEISTACIYVGGVFNGKSTSTPTHRACIPSNVAISIPNQEGVSSIGSALFLREATFRNRTVINTEQCPGATIELRWYAHQLFRNLFVFEVEGVGITSPW